jgi:hypothetical protein
MCMSGLEIKVYTDKSIVVIGNTTEYKEQLKDLGGKWNSSLTDKTSGEKFGGWIFPSSKKTLIENSFKNFKAKPVEKPVEKPSYDDRLITIEAKIEKLISLFTKVVEKAEKDYDMETILSYTKELLKNIDKDDVKQKNITIEDAEDIEDDTFVPTKRLLKK